MSEQLPEPLIIPGDAGGDVEPPPPAPAVEPAEELPPITLPTVIQ